MSKSIENDLNFNGASRVVQLPYPTDTDEAANVDYVESQIMKSYIPTGTSFTIREHRQMINFTKLTLDGMLTIQGDLWLA